MRVGPLRRQPAYEPVGQLVEKARGNVVAQLAVQHAALRMRQVKPPPRAGDGDISEASLLLDPVEFRHAVFVRKQPLLQPGDEDGMKLEALRRMDGHQLQCRPPLGSLGLARLERGMREERGQRAAGSELRVAGDLPLGFAHEALRRVDQLLQVLDPILAILFRAVVA